MGGGRLRQLSARADAWAARHDLLLGGVYVVHASKQVAGLHPPRRSCGPRRGSLVGLVPKSAPVPVPQTPYPRKKPNKVKGNVTA